MRDCVKNEIIRREQIEKVVSIEVVRINTCRKKQRSVSFKGLTGRQTTEEVLSVRHYGRPLRLDQ